MRLLGGLALLSILVVAAIVMFGQTAALDSFFGGATTSAGPREQGPTGTTKAKTPIEQALGIREAQALAQIFNSVRGDFILAGSEMSDRELLRALRANGDLADIKIVTRPREGTFVFKRLGPSRLALCTELSGGWHCSARDLAVDKRAETYAASLKKAQAKAAKALKRA